MSLSQAPLDSTHIHTHAHQHVVAPGARGRYLRVFRKRGAPGLALQPEKKGAGYAGLMRASFPSPLLRPLIQQFFLPPGPKGPAGAPQSHQPQQ